jgi:AP endonuclease-2
MRILTWNVNALRTVLPFKPWNSLPDRSIRGMLDAMEADIICFQEHKARRDAMTREMALPEGYDAFFSFAMHGKSGYSGTCVYTRREAVVPLKAEEGITGTLLGVQGANSAQPKLVYELEERIGGYPDEEDIHLMDEVDGTRFEWSRLDKEGRAVVCDFG